MITNLQAASFNHFGAGLGSHAQARQVGTRLFERAHARGQFKQLVARLACRPNSLRSLSHQPIGSSRTSGTVIVPLDKIVGSESRTEDFDAQFHPLKQHNRERWINIAAARFTGVTLPAVELVQVGDKYYVRDGHHRISVARVMGQVEIDARIVNSSTQPESRENKSQEYPDFLLHSAPVLM